MPTSAKEPVIAKPAPSPVVVFGIDSRGKPKGARFAKEFAGIATKAANQLQLQVVGSNNPKVADIAARLPVGRVHGNGRTFVPFIRRDLYDKLLAATANGNVSHSTSPPASAASGGGGTDDGSKPNLPKNWQEIGVGDLVLAQETREDGWFEAICTEVSGDMVSLRWRDYPRERRLVRHRRRLGLLYPEAQSSAQPGKAVKVAATLKSDKTTAKTDTPTLPKDWRDIDVNTLVLARDEGPFLTWWEAVPIEKNGETFKLRWRDHASIPPITRPRVQLALICPDPA